MSQRASAEEDRVAYLRLLVRDQKKPQDEKIIAMGDAIVAIDIHGRATSQQVAALAEHSQGLRDDIRAVHASVKSVHDVVADIQAALIVRDERMAKRVAERTSLHVTKAGVKLAAPATVFLVIVEILRLFMGS